MPRGRILDGWADMRWYGANVISQQSPPSQPEVQNYPQPPPYDAGYYQCPPIPTWTARVSGTYTYNSCSEVNTKDNTKEEVKVKVTAKDVTVCSACGSYNLTETPDPMVAKECLSCGSLMLVDGDVLQMAV